MEGFTVGLALLEAIAYYFMFRNSVGALAYRDGFEGVIAALTIIVSFTAGAMLVVWLGERIDADEDCVKLSGGYDNNFIISEDIAAVVTAPNSGITMTVTTTEPGVQFYSGNFMKFRKGKGGVNYHRRYGFCLETQHYPDSIHHPEWPTCILKAGEVYESTTRYSF